MKILLITDTHGDIDAINDLIERERADACIHCGDFGLYDPDSVDRLSVRELRLRLKHSQLPKDVRKRAWKLSPDDLRQTVRDAGLLGSLAPYLTGEAGFRAPVYAVWGNHEDAEVVRALRDGRSQIENLHFLDDRTAHCPAPWLRLIGLGGNFYFEGIDGLFAPDLVGSGGKVRSSWVQYARLLAREQARQSAPRPFTVFVSHVSPGKARLLERLALLLGADLAICGHMNPPVSHAYSLFTICEPDEAMARSDADVRALREAWAGFDGALSDADRAVVEQSLAAVDVAPFPVRERGSRAAPGSLESRFYTTQFVTLGDMPESWSVLDIDETGATLTHRSAWRTPPHVSS